MTLYSQNQHQSGTPDCPMVHRTVFGAPGWLGVNQALSGKEMGGVAIIHRIVRWCKRRKELKQTPSPGVANSNEDQTSISGLAEPRDKSMCLCALLCVVCRFSVLFDVCTCTSILICGTGCLRSVGYFKTRTSIPLQPTRRVFHSTAIQPLSRVRNSSYKVIIIIRLFTPPLGDIQILFPGIGNFHQLGTPPVSCLGLQVGPR